MKNKNKMKKLVVLLAAAALFSCKKSYTCECTDTYKVTGESWVTSYATHGTLNKVTIGCEQGNMEDELYVVECVIK
jgi:hypothetical protein